jgi:hypothetical protein
MSQKYKGKRSNNIHRQELSKIQNNRRIEKSLQVAQKRGTKILQVSNPADPLNASNREKSVPEVGFALLWLLPQEAGNHGLNNL